jgi:riboflavin biosynthesis pyrimidine reductase
MEVFRRLLPGPLEERFSAADVAAAVPGESPAGRPFVLLNMIVTPSPDAELPPCAAEVGYLREGDLGVALRRLREEQGVESIDCEGGPGLNATLVPAGLVDELHLVIAPKLAGGRDPLTLLGGDTLDPPVDLELLSLHESGGYLFARYGL